MIGITITLINITGMLNISTNGLLSTLLAFHKLLIKHAVLLNQLCICLKVQIQQEILEKSDRLL